MLWEKGEKAPNIRFVRKKLLDQSPVRSEELKQKMLLGIKLAHMGFYLKPTFAVD